METSVQAPASNDTLESAAETKAPKYRAVACRKAQPDDHLADPPRIGYPTPEAAAARCKELGHDVSDMEEHEDAWLFHQKGMECKVEGGDLEDIEPGMRGIGCGSASDRALAPDEHGYQDPPAKKSIRKSDRDATAGEREAVASGNNATLSRIPFGAQYIKDYSGHHQLGISMHDEHAGMLENPPIAEANEAWRQEDIARAQEMDGLLGELYPDLAKAEAHEVPGVEALEPITAKRFKDALRGGVGDKANEQLEAGIKVEMEHTNDPDIAREIAMDHLAEDPEYYSKLQTIEPEQKGETPADSPLGEDEELPYGATYLQKVAAHCDAGQAQLADGLKRQEHPRVRDFAEDETARLEERKSACRDLMGEHYPDHVAKVFGAEAPEETIEDPENQETKLPESDDGDHDQDDEGEEPEETMEEEHEEEEHEEEEEGDDDEEEEKKKPKKSADLLRSIIKSLADLTSAVAACKAGVKPVAKAAPVARPAPKAKPRQEPAAAQVDPKALEHLEQLKRENARLQKEVGRLIGTEKRFQIRLASKIGTAAKTKKKDHCHCKGTCADCKTKGTFFSAKDMSAIDESAGGALVKPATQEKSELQDCVSRKIPIFMREHPDWTQEHAVAASFGFCGEQKGEVKSVQRLPNGDYDYLVEVT